MPSAPDAIAMYPAQYESDVVLRDGSTVRLRPVRRDDEHRLADVFRRMSPESRRNRFFGIVQLDGEAARLVRSDHDQEFVLVAEAGERLIGVATYVRDVKVSTRAEVAFAIVDAVQGRGLGTRMLEVLAGIARERGLSAFDAYVQQHNERMLRVFVDSGFELHRRLEGGVLHIVLSLVPTPTYEAKAAGRSQAAATASLKAFFEPRTVAVIGANRERGRIGSEILHNILSGGFQGRVFAVHPLATTIDSVPAFPRLTAIPEAVDLAVICVPCAQVDAAVDDCIAKGVKAVVIISAGFGETGAAGRVLEQALLRKIRAAGIRMIGPNCMGIINTDPGVGLNATFAPVAPVAGRVAFSTQSGALGLAILEYVQQLNLGISTFVSVGNKADVSGNDLLQYWADDPRTDVILLYLESFGNPRHFGRIARRVAAKKPIVAVKSGRSRAGARAAASHTGALAASDAVVDGLFRQAGVIRTNTVEELFDVASLLAHQPLPHGSRIAILSNAGGPAILAADAAEAHGLALAALSDATIAALRDLLPPAASVGNPVDMLADASAERYRAATELLLADAGVDSLVVIFIPPLVTRPEDVARAIAGGAAGSTKPVAASFMGAQGAPAALAPIPSYRFPEAAVTAVALVTGYGEWRRRPDGSHPVLPGIDRAAARQVVDGALTRGDGWLTPSEAQALVEAVGIAVAPVRMVSAEDEAVATADAIGYPVALKAAGPEIVHKTEIGGVMVDLADADAVRAAFRGMQARVGSAMTGAVVQQMVTGGVELLLGAVVDPTFGPLVACGTGGVLVDLLHDTQFRLHPLTDLDARDLVDGLHGVALLRGYRGQPPADEAAVREALLRVSALLDICPELQELDVNPLKVLPGGVKAVDVRIRVGRREATIPTRRVSY